DGRLSGELGLADGAPSAAPVGFWKRFGALYALGFVGVLGIIPIAVPSARQQLQSLPGLDLSLPAFVVLSLVNPLVTLAVAVAVGVRLADRVHLRSHLDEWVKGGPFVRAVLPELPIALLLGAAGGTAIVLLDLALAPWVGADLPGPGMLPPRGLGITLAGMLYGGIAEELMLRWGMMTFLAWAVWRTVGRGLPRPGNGAMWGAIIGAAVAFGAGHLPAMATLVPLTAPLVFRTIALNAFGGILFGWL